MPEGVPNRLPALLWLAIEQEWSVSIDSFAELTVTFHRVGEKVDLRWNRDRRLESAEYAVGIDGRPRRCLLRDVPSILRGGT